MSESLISSLVVLFVVVLSTCLPWYIWYRIGKYAEDKHYKSIIEREKKYINLPFSSSDTVDASKAVAAVGMVSGLVVIGTDPFKRYIAGLMNLVGGRVSVFEAPLDRARRESILRMKKEAVKLGADEIVNFRMETMSISGSNGNAQGIVEVMTYGTAIKYKSG